MAVLRQIRRKKLVVKTAQKTYRYGPSKTWRVVYRVWLPDGQVVEKTRETRTKSRGSLLLADAEKLEAKSQRRLLDEGDVRAFHAVGLLNDREAERFLGRPADPTWEQVIAQYESASATRCRPGTHLRNMSKARTSTAWFSNRGLIPDQLSLNDVETWKADRKRAGAQNKTVNLELDILRQLLDPVFGQRDHPARQASKLDVARMGRLPRAMTPEEDERALRLAYQRRGLLRGYFWPLYLLYRFGGLRRDEARWISWTHVLEDRVLVQETPLSESELTAADRFHGNVWRPKEGEARAVPLPAWVLAELRALPRNGRLVFAPEGRPFHPDAISQACQKVLHQVAPDLTLHDLRHTCITHAMEAGIPSARVQRLAGHRLLSTTERYTHVAVEGRARDLERVYRDIVGSTSRSALRVRKRTGARVSGVDRTVQYPS